jgi:hypothetical protein
MNEDNNKINDDSVDNCRGWQQQSFIIQCGIKLI